MLTLNDTNLLNYKRSSACHLFYSLVLGKIIPNELWRSHNYRIKFAIRSLLFSKTSFLWFERLALSPMLANLLQVQPGLPCRLHRPYLANNLKREEQYQYLIDHYDFVEHNFPENLKQGCYNTSQTDCIDRLIELKYKLAKFKTKTGAIFSLCISADDKFNKEGELTLSLYNENAIVLARLTFCFIRYRNEYTMFIGGLQGGSTETKHHIIRDATKVCHGLFPKKIITESARHLANLLKVNHAIAVSNQSHIYNNWRYSSRKKHFYADYNSFWESLGGQKNSDGYYNLTTQCHEKSIIDIPSKKRAEYQRRYELLNNIYENMTQHFYDSTETKIR